ncbi:hypothetical protein LXL04_012343 [Taraxacum kok-saghyz]
MKPVMRWIDGFHNCDGCARKVRTTLRRFHDLQLVNLDRESGNVTVSTAEHPETIRYALQRRLKKPIVIVSTSQNPNSVASSLVPAQHGFDLQGLGEIVLGMSQVLDGVEITHTNGFKINFIRRENPPIARAEPRANISSYGGVHIEEADVEYAPRRPTPRAPPWPVAEPSAPLIPVEKEEVYGYPPEFYGFSATDRHDRRDGCCSVM